MLPAPLERESPLRTRIKICGMTSVEMAIVAVEAGADAIGLIHAQHSPRFLSPQQAEEISRNLPLSVQAVSVFQDHAIEDAIAWATEVVQLHGHESAAYIVQLRQSLSNIHVIRAVAFNADDVRSWDGFDYIDALLIEGATAGTGASFIHDELVEMMPVLRKPVILAGGLTPNNVGDAIRRVKPYGVDVSSGVESSRGVKDKSLIEEFCAAVREADESLASAHD